MSADNPSANVALNILANGVVVGTGTLSGLAQGAPWTPVTATWTATALTLAKRSSSKWWRRTSSKGRRQWQVPTFGFTDATLTATRQRSGRSQRSDGHRRLFEPDQPELDE